MPRISIKLVEFIHFIGNFQFLDWRKFLRASQCKKKPVISIIKLSCFLFWLQRSSLFIIRCAFYFKSRVYWLHAHDSFIRCERKQLHVLCDENFSKFQRAEIMAGKNAVICRFKCVKVFDRKIAAEKFQFLKFT